MNHILKDSIKRVHITDIRVEYRENGPAVALAALVFLFLGFFLEHTWKLRVP